MIANKLSWLGPKISVSTLFLLGLSLYVFEGKPAPAVESQPMPGNAAASERRFDSAESFLVFQSMGDHLQPRFLGATPTADKKGIVVPDDVSWFVVPSGPEFVAAQVGVQPGGLQPGGITGMQPGANQTGKIKIIRIGLKGIGVTGLGVTGLGVTGLGITGLGITGIGLKGLMLPKGLKGLDGLPDGLQLPPGLRGIQPGGGQPGGGVPGGLGGNVGGIPGGATGVPGGFGGVPGGAPELPKERPNLRETRLTPPPTRLDANIRQG